MSRVCWGAGLAAIFALLWWKIDWLYSLPAAQMAAAQVVALLAVIICGLGLILPPKWSEPAQAVVLFFGLFAVAGGAIMAL